jgi:hypothetical protein
MRFPSINDCEMAEGGVVHQRLEGRFRFAERRLDAASFGHVDGKDQPFCMAVVVEFETYDLRRKNAAILATMPPYPEMLMSIATLADGFQKCGNTVLGADIEHGHVHEFLPRVAISVYRSIIHLEKAQGLAVKNPHGAGIG